jgi:hypothetical protein
VGTWDGSDLFVPDRTYCSCVVSRLREALVRAGMAGISFERMSEVTVPV